MQTIEIIKLIANPALCTACRACELACHYHHTGRFGTACSSVQVRYDGRTSDLEIVFLSTCDQCASEVRPFCVRACVPSAICWQE